MRAPERRAEQLCVEAIGACLPACPTRLLEPIAVRRTLHRCEELMHDAEISERHAARAVAQVAAHTVEVHSYCYQVHQLC